MQKNLRFLSKHPIRTPLLHFDGVFFVKLTWFAIGKLHQPAKAGALALKGLAYAKNDLGINGNTTHFLQEKVSQNFVAFVCI